MNLIDRHFGITPTALSVRAKRFEMIASNLANADTPGYKAKDIDFASAMASVSGTHQPLLKTDARHMSINGGMGAQSMEDLVRFRTNLQPSLDGNTVETDVEHNEFMQNAIYYQASVNFLDSRISSFRLALKGE